MQIQHPTDAEMEILQILWQQGPLSVRDVNLHLQHKRSVGYTTTLKIMQIMTDKGLLNRDTSMRSHIYDAAIRQESTTNSILGQMIENVFNGSASKLVMQALGNHKTSPEELEAIKALIDKIENQ